MNRRERRKRAAADFRDRRRETLMTSTEGAIEFAIKVSLDAAKLRDEESRRHGLEVPNGGGAFLFLRRYELNALAELLADDDVPVALFALRTHFEQAELYEVKGGGQG